MTHDPLIIFNIPSSEVWDHALQQGHRALAGAEAAEKDPKEGVTSDSENPEGNSKDSESYDPSWAGMNVDSVQSASKPLALNCNWFRDFIHKMFLLISNSVPSWRKHPS